MAVTKLDISLAARAAGHLYLTTTFFGLLCLGGVVGASARFLAEDWRNWQTDVGVLGVSLMILGSLSAMYYARRELNGWAYVIATLCTVLLGLVTGAGGFFILTDEKTDVQRWSAPFLATIYSVRVLTDYSRLALSGHNASSIPPLRLANEVSKLLRRRRSLVPLIHVPTDPGRTFFYAILFLVSFVGLNILLWPVGTMSYVRTGSWNFTIAARFFSFARSPMIKSGSGERAFLENFAEDQLTRR
jgi:hypothetical protein